MFDHTTPSDSNTSKKRCSCTCGTSIMVFACGRGGHNDRGRHPQHVLNAYTVRECHIQENCFSLHDFPNKIANVSKAEAVDPKFSYEEYQEYLRLKSNNLAQSSTNPSSSTTCVSQSMVCKNGSFHLRGNVYVQYKALDSALHAANLMNHHDFAGKRVTCQFVNLTRWKVAICGEYMKSGFKTCSRGTACNFIHCFRNPGGDYEWADSDKPPPKFWVEKMIALFGYSDDYETSREQGNFSLSKTDSDRYHCRRSRSREMDQISCGYSGRRKHEDERKQRTPYEDRNASLKNTRKRKSRGRTPDTDSDREWLEKEEIRERRHEYTRNGSFNKSRDENSRSHEEDSDVDCDTRDNEKQHGRNPRKCDKDIRVWINEAAGLDGDRDVRKHRIRESSGHQSGDASESNKDLFGRVEMETLHDHSRKTYSHRRSGVQVSVKGRDQNDKVDRDGSRKDSYKRDHHKRK